MNSSVMIYIQLVLLKTCLKCSNLMLWNVLDDPLLHLVCMLHFLQILTFSANLFYILKPLCFSCQETLFSCVNSFPTNYLLSWLLQLLYWLECGIPSMFPDLSTTSLSRLPCWHATKICRRSLWDVVSHFTHSSSRALCCKVF